MSAAAGKDTIYIDAEDEITAIIDKMRVSPAKIVALVLPKRSSVLQSVVNLKLLKHTAAEAKKNLVLITSDPNLMPLAGAVGLHVAKTLQSQPSVPVPPTQNDTAITVDNSDIEEDLAPDPNASVGHLAGQLAAEETIELDNETPAEAAIAAAPKKPLNKKLKVPDFDRFRLILFAGIGLLVLLIIGGIFAFIILPKAKIVIKTDTASVNTNLNLTADTAIKTVDSDKGLVPGISKQFKKTDGEKVPATGQRDDGTKASGKATLALTDCSQPAVTVPAGTAISSNSLSFVTQASATLISTVKGGKCSNDSDATASVNVAAQNAGDKYNLGDRTYTVNGFSNVSAAGSTMTGGTSKITQIVSQQDVNNAKQKVLDRVGAAAAADLKTQFTTDNAIPLADTLAAGDPVVTSSPNVNDPGSDVSVNVNITFTELGVKQDDLKQVLETDVKKHIDNSRQTIQDNGLGKAVLHLSDKVSATQAKFQLQAIAVAGPQLDAEGIKKDIAGKKKGATVTLIQSRPGIKDVSIKYSPFWVVSTPKKTSHITIIFEQNNGGK